MSTIIPNDPLAEIANRSKASQNKEELLDLLRVVYNRQPDIVLEIGVHLGYSLEVWQEAFRPELIIGIEKDKLVLEEDPSLVLLSPADSQAKSTVDEVKRVLNGRSIDFMFIDGDHTFDGVMRDWNLYEPFLADDALVGFHDIVIQQEDVEVYRFWHMIKQLYPCEEFVHEGGTGTGLIFFYRRPDE